MSRILIVDDSELIRATLSEVIRMLGHEVVCAATLEEGLNLLSERNPAVDVVLLDVCLPDGNGLDMLPHIAALPDRPEVIIITSRGERDGALLAIQNGVWDYIEKGDSYERMELSLSRALNYRRQRKTYRPLSQVRRNGIIGDSPPISACLELVSTAAGSSASILLRGETGTGKELFAKTIHLNSSRGSGPFVVVDCASLPEHLAESVLFGHVRGAFTGADRNHVGLVAQADRGTLFLDELGELPFSLQKTLLRVLQERKYRPVGGLTETPSDFRLVAATNRDIDQMVAEGLFRRDLLYRLRSFVIHLPPLRERGADIELLAHHFVAGIAGRNRQAVPDTSPEFLESLRDYPWPGNVRELSNALEVSMLEARGAEVLEVSFLPREIREHQARMRFRSPDAEVSQPVPIRVESAFADGGGLRTWKDVKDEVVGRAARRYFEDLLENTRGDMSRASELCGMSRPNLYAMLRRYGISTRRW